MYKLKCYIIICIRRTTRRITLREISQSLHWKITLTRLYYPKSCRSVILVLKYIPQLCIIYSTNAFKKHNYSLSYNYSLDYVSLSCLWVSLIHEASKHSAAVTLKREYYLINWTVLCMFINKDTDRRNPLPVSLW